MDFGDQQARANLRSMITAAVIAVLSTAALFLFEINPSKNTPQSGISMLTSAVIDRAGATVLPTDPATKPKPISYTR